MKLRPVLLLSLLLAGSLAHAAAGDTDYAIRLTRTTTVGEHYRAVSSGTDEQSAAANIDGKDLPPRSETFAVELVADCEALAVTSSGRETKARMVIVKFVRQVAGQPVELLPAGSVVIAERIGPKTVYTTGDTPAPPIVGRALDILGVNMASEDEATDDMIFGATERKKVGDSWPVNSAAAKADLLKRGIPAEASSLTGNVTHVEATNPGKDAQLRISSSLSIKGVVPPMPPGMAVQSSEMSASLSGIFPADVAKPQLQQSAEMRMAITASGTNNGRTMIMTMTKKTSHEVKFTRN